MAVSCCSSSLHREQKRGEHAPSANSPPPLTGLFVSFWRSCHWPAKRLPKNRWPSLSRPPQAAKRVGIFRVLNTVSFKWWRRPQPFQPFARTRPRRSWQESFSSTFQIRCCLQISTPPLARQCTWRGCLWKYPS